MNLNPQSFSRVDRMNNKFVLRNYLILSAALTLAACGGEPEVESAAKTAADPGQTVVPDLAILLVSESRTEADRARDAGRKPLEVIAALGIEPGMKVLDVIAASGWYTEVLSLAVGPDGHVATHNTAFTLQMRDGANEQALTKRLANDRLPNVSRLDKEIADFSAEDGRFDAALTALNLHDIYNRGGDAAAIGAMRAVYSVLKPGGVFGVIDHQGIDGQDNEALHRMWKTDAIRVAEAAGFVVEADLGVLHFHDDDMTKHMRDDSVRGRTHRFLLKLRKPE